MEEKVKNPNGVVVHYHEIALKGDNRPVFIRQLADNIRRATGSLGVGKIEIPRGRIILHLEGGARWEHIAERLEKVFGIANFSPVWRCPTRLPVFKKTVAGLIEGRSFSSFRIAARRPYKAYPLTSMEVNQKLGRFVQERSGASVDLENPDLSIFLEILEKESLVYLEKRRGPGGLPVGAGGRVVSLLSGGIDSPVASYLMMKRGCRATFVHFHGHPYLTRASAEKAEELAEHLTEYQFESKLHLVPFGEVQRRIVLSAPAPLRVVLYRRFMLRIAEEVALLEKARALVTGESLGQVASQTLENLATIEEAAHLPVLRPLIGSDKEEIINLAKNIGTYPISILPDQDCCRLFIPPHPSVGAGIDEVRRAESRLDIHGLVKLGLEGAEVLRFGGRSDENDTGKMP
jgi:thiamine biosynthesis protein ThiI